jgi:predicted amidohydrolase YtcJ
VVTQCSSPDRIGSPPEPVTLLVNADIVTMNEAAPDAEALAYKGDRIIAIGSEADVRAAIMDYDRFFDLGGKTVVPGFIESHDHLYASSGTSMVADVSPFETPTLAEALEKLTLVQPDDEGWIVAFGADQTLYEERRGPTRDVLDPLFPTSPVIVFHLSGHAAFMNSAGLRRVGLDESTEDPVGGYYERDSEGRMTGYLSGQPAFLPYKPYPDATPATAVKASQSRAAVGITTASEFAIMNAFVLEGLSEASKLPGFATRIVGGYFSTAPDYDEIVPRLSSYETALFTVPFVKTWTDGSPQGGTAHFIDGYHDPSMGSGGAQGTQEYFNALIADVMERGMWPAIHANGDGAVDVALNAVAAGLKNVPEERRRGCRPQLIHAQFTTSEQMERMAVLGISPTFFTTHVFYWGDLHYERTVGPERAQRLNAMADAFDQNLKVAMHNDPPVTRPDPILNMWIAVNRQSSSGRVIGADQAISPLQALQSYTINAAYQFGMEKQAGSLEVGKLADFLVLDRNPLTVDAGNIRNVKVMATVMGGRVTFSRDPVYDSVHPF